MDSTVVFAVIDTCVLLSALRSNLGASFAILRAVRRGDIRMALSVALAIEYESVALRPGLVPALTAAEIRIVLDVLCGLAHPQKIFYTWRPFLPDPGDDLVLELAAAAGCTFIVTHHLPDFKGSDSLGVRTITPAQALNLI